MTIDFNRRLVAEALGTALLVTAVVGSGIMAARLAGGNVGLALLANTIATGAVLFVLIAVLGPISGAHFNPAVTTVMVLSGRMPAPEAGGYVVAQIVGGVVGSLLAHVMFELPILQLSSTARTGSGQWVAEAVAAFGLLVTILGLSSQRAEVVGAAVGLYITSAYWFTASTSFANPAVTIARALSDTFAGINPAHVPAFIAAQLAGAVAAWALMNWLAKPPG